MAGASGSGCVSLFFLASSGDPKIRIRPQGPFWVVTQRDAKDPALAQVVAECLTRELAERIKEYLE